MFPLYFFTFVALCFQSVITIDEHILIDEPICETKTGFSGVVKYMDDALSGGFFCWKIKVPTNNYVRLQFKEIYSSDCVYAYVKINISLTGEQHRFCSSNDIKNPIISLSDVTIRAYNPYVGNIISFELFYNIESIICAELDSVRCSNHSCVSKDKVCDGVKDCENGADEKECETGVFRIRGVEESRRNAISWLKSRRTKFWGWKENTHRAVVALYLADGANFNGTDLEEELMAKEVELETSVAILRNGTDSVSPNELSLFVNSLLTVCLNPRKFYGFDLVELLKSHLTVSSTIPVVYLALCNANETMPEDTIPNLKEVLSTNLDYPFLIDFQAMALLTLSCMNNRKIDLDNEGNYSIMHTYNATMKQFKSMQHQDGSFGNAYQTALVTQVLLSGGEENSKDWDLNAAVRYLMAHLNSSSIDFLTTYLTLPILNGKTLVDIAKINCSGNPRKNREDQVADIENKLGPKIRVQYSLYVGDEKDIVYTLSLRVPANITAYEIMKIAAAADDKYNFKGKQVSGKMYVYEIASISNDPEAGKFWLLYKGPISNSTAAIHYIDSPDRLIVQDQEHLIMWYKYVNI